jgi:hypothetical protein
MYVRDHPPPHFHAVYGEHEAFVSIDTGEVIGGALPKAAARLVKEWTLARQNQLRENWRRARTGQQPERIAVSMLTKVVRLDRLGGFRLRVRFNDGSGGSTTFPQWSTSRVPCSSGCGTRPTLVACSSNSARPPGRTAATLRRNGYAAKWRPLVN